MLCIFFTNTSHKHQYHLHLSYARDFSIGTFRKDKKCWNTSILVFRDAYYAFPIDVSSCSAFKATHTGLWFPLHKLFVNSALESRNASGVSWHFSSRTYWGHFVLLLWDFANSSWSWFSRLPMIWLCFQAPVAPTHRVPTCFTIYQPSCAAVDCVS